MNANLLEEAMNLLKQIWSWTRSLGIAVVLVLFVGIFIFQPYKVDGHSMDPSLQDKERIYVSKLNHTFSYLPNFGDIVIIDSRVLRERTFKDDLMENSLWQLINGNSGDHTFYIKRVIGLPGDTLQFKEHKVFRNGVALQENYINETMDYVSEEILTVPDKHIFVMGDNRNHSNDSRAIGFIPLDHVIGKKIP
jgi:signal peptidase I